MANSNWDKFWQWVERLEAMHAWGKRLIWAVPLVGTAAVAMWSVASQLAPPVVATLAIFAGASLLAFAALFLHLKDRALRHRVALPTEPGIPILAPVVGAAGEYSHLLADIKANYEAKLKEQQEKTTALHHALNEAHGAIDAGVTSGHGLQQEVAKITNERDDLKRSLASQQMSNTNARQLDQELRTTKLDLKNLQDVQRYGPPVLSALSVLNDEELIFLQRDMTTLSGFFLEANNALMKMRYDLVVEMQRKGSVDTAYYLAERSDTEEQGINTQIVTRFLEQAPRPIDSREAFAAACLCYAKRHRDVARFAACMNRPLESLDKYEAWRAEDEKYQEVLKKKLAQKNFLAMRIWWESSPSPLNATA